MRYELESTEVFDSWLENLDGSIKRRIANRLTKVERGNFGDHKALGDRLCELRCTFGGGIRMYYSVCGNVVVILLCGGNKSSQKKDMQAAKDMLNEQE